MSGNDEMQVGLVDRPRRRAPLLAFGMGLVAGGLEAIQLGATLRLDMDFGQALVLALCCVVLGGFLAGGLSLFMVALMTRVGRSRLSWWQHSFGMSGTAALLGAWYLWPVAADKWALGLTPAALAFAGVPLGIAGVAWFNAGYWLRREEYGVEIRYGWRVWAPLAGVALALVSAFWMSRHDYGSARALDDDPSVVLITIDTLRWDHLGVYGDSPVQTPVFDALAEEGILFTNAITPMPETAPAHAALFTGRHPVRSGVLSNGHPLSMGHETLAEVLEAEGYATAAFVSSFAVDSRTGLNQGFEVYDDDFFPWVRGFTEIRLVSVAARLYMRIGEPTDVPFLLERPAPVTYERALTWMARNHDRPFFAWVHLFDPHSPYEPHGLPGFEDNGTSDAPSADHRWILSNEAQVTYDEALQEELRRLYAEEVAYTDAELGRFLEALAEVVERPVLRVVTADHGEMLGEHDIMFNHHGIYDEAIRVPLVVLPHKEIHAMDADVSAQVRLMDVPATILGLIGLDEMPHSEGIDLTAYAQGTRRKSLASLLMGRKTASLAKGTLFGYRAARVEGGDIKFILDADSGDAKAYDLGIDSTEQTDIAAAQPAVITTLRGNVLSEVGELAQGIPSGPALDGSTRDALEALGYVE